MRKSRGVYWNPSQNEKEKEMESSSWGPQGRDKRESQELIQASIWLSKHKTQIRRPRDFLVVEWLGLGTLTAEMFSWIQNNQCFLPQLLLVVLSSFSAFLLKYIHKLLGTVWLQASFLLCLLSLPLFPENSRTCFSETVGLVQLLSRVWLFVTHGLQHTRLPCPSPTPGAYSNSCP